MEKKRLFSFVFILIVAFSLSGIFDTATAETKPINLSMASFFPPTHFVNTEQAAQWIKEVEEASGGYVKITFYPGGTLLKAPETYDGVVKGTADIGISVFAYTRGRFPVMEAFEQGYKKFKPKELSDVKVMYLYSVGPGSLYSKKEVKSLEDLKGMRIRSTGLTAKSIQALGATPIAMPMGEVYESLRKGVVDGNIAPPEVLKGWKQAEVTKYITIVPPVYNAIQFIVMNLEKWNSLPSNVQKAIEEVNEASVFKAGQIWDSQMKAGGIDYGIKEHGMKICRLSAEDNAKAVALMQPLLDEYVARMAEKGLPGKEIVEFVQERAAFYSKLFPPGY